MKIQLASDLHLEGRRYALPIPERDVLILAGDIQVGNRGADWVLNQAENSQVIYVPGNHEYYRHQKDAVDLWWADATDHHPTLVYAPRKVVWLKGVKFVCASFWPDCWNDAAALELSGRFIADYKLIKADEDRLWTPEDAAQHLKDYEFLLEHIEPGCVVVTHWPPTKDCVAAKFKGDNMNPYFVNNHPELLDENPALWLCGHTHGAFDFHHGVTRIVNNPLGYGGEHDARAAFQPEMILEI